MRLLYEDLFVGLQKKVPQIVRFSYVEKISRSRNVSVMDSRQRVPQGDSSGPAGESMQLLREAKILRSQGNTWDSIRRSHQALLVAQERNNPAIIGRVRQELALANASYTDPTTKEEIRGREATFYHYLDGLHAIEQSGKLQPGEYCVKIRPTEPIYDLLRTSCSDLRYWKGWDHGDLLVFRGEKNHSTRKAYLADKWSHPDCKTYTPFTVEDEIFHTKEWKDVASNLHHLTTVATLCTFLGNVTESMNARPEDITAKNLSYYNKMILKLVGNPSDPIPNDPDVLAQKATIACFAKALQSIEESGRARSTLVASRVVPHVVLGHAGSLYVEPNGSSAEKRSSKFHFTEAQSLAYSYGDQSLKRFVRENYEQYLQRDSASGSSIFEKFPCRFAPRWFEQQLSGKKEEHPLEYAVSLGEFLEPRPVLPTRDMNVSGYSMKDPRLSDDPTVSLGKPQGTVSFSQSVATVDLSDRPGDANENAREIPPFFQSRERRAAFHGNDVESSDEKIRKDSTILKFVVGGGEVPLNDIVREGYIIDAAYDGKSGVARFAFNEKTGKEGPRKFMTSVYDVPGNRELVAALRQNYRPDDPEDTSCHVHIVEKPLNEPFIVHDLSPNGFDYLLVDPEPYPDTPQPSIEPFGKAGFLKASQAQEKYIPSPMIISSQGLHVPANAGIPDPRSRNQFSGASTRGRDQNQTRGRGGRGNGGLSRGG